MTAFLFAEPTARPLTDAGGIMPGAKLTFYATGTTTKTDTYSDADLDTENANPVVADADGRFSPIYLDPTTVYRVQLHDADDVLIYDVDPYLPAKDFAPGTVLMFYGTETALEAAYPPAEWQQLNGNNGAPDIRDRFPVGVSSTIDVGDTGGAASGNTGSAGGHDHGGATGDHTLTEAEMPAHAHEGWFNAGFERDPPPTITDGHHTAPVIPGETQNNSGTTDTELNSDTGTLTDETGDGEAHSHTITAAAAHTHTVSVNPPYLGLWFIMRRST